MAGSHRAFRKPQDNPIEIHMKNLPEIGIRPAIDGRLGGVTEARVFENFGLLCGRK